MDYASAIDQLKSLVQVDLSGDDADRHQALKLARQLCSRLETPVEAVGRIGWVETSFPACLKVAVECGALDRLLQGPLPLAQLAAATGASAALLARVMRMLELRSVVDQPTPGVYALQPHARQFASSPSCRAALNYAFDVLVPANAALPAYLAKRGYQLPTAGDEVWKFATGADKTIYEWFQEHKASAADFETMMVEYSADRKRWWQLFPLAASHVDGWEPSAGSLLVDVGGGLGQDLDAFREAFAAKLDSRTEPALVLQDLPHVIDQARARHEDSAIQYMPYSFYDPQPINGARLYYMHSVLFNHNDDIVAQALANLRDAMTPGYSKLMINEMACATHDTPEIVAGLDIVLLSVFNSRMRTEDDWAALCKRAGLSMDAMYTSPEAKMPESLIQISKPAAA